MASPSTTEAGYFSIPAIPNRYYFDCRPTDQLFEVLPFEPIVGKDLQLNVIDASAADGLGTYATAAAAGVAISQAMPTISKRTFDIARIAAEVPIDSIVAGGIYSSANNLAEALLSIKVNAARDKFKDLLIEGKKATSGEFDGLAMLTNTYSQDMGAANGATDGGTVAKGEMEELLALIKPRKPDGSTYFVMHSKAFMHLLKNNYDYVEYSDHPTLGSVPAFAGVPVLIDEFIPTNEVQGASSDCTSIYATRLGKDVGLCGIYPAVDEQQPIQVRGPVVKEGSDAQWYHVSWNAGIAVYNTCSIARMFGVKWSN